MTYLPYQRHSATSQEAAESVEPAAETWLGKVYRAIERAGLHGATDEELQDDLGLNPSTERPRRIELVARKLVVASEQTRMTRSRRRAQVWVATKWVEAQLTLPLEAI